MNHQLDELVDDERAEHPRSLEYGPKGHMDHRVVRAVPHFQNVEHPESVRRPLVSEVGAGDHAFWEVAPSAGPVWLLGQNLRHC